MPDLLSVLTSLAWPLAIALAWLAGEFGQRWTGLPRISFYGLVGFALGSTPIWARSRCWPISPSAWSCSNWATASTCAGSSTIRGSAWPAWSSPA
jgi:hypothetical protein